MSKREIKAANVVNLTGGITTEDGRLLFGMDAETYLRIKEKEDPELERKTGEWIEDILGRSIADTSNLYLSLKDGVVLCELINKIQPNAVKKIATPKAGKPLHVLQERENINQYLSACYKIGMSRDALFVVSDLHGRQGMSSVIQNLTALSQKAVYYLGRDPSKSGGVNPIGSSKSLSELKQSKKVKWEVNIDTTPIMAAELSTDDLASKYNVAVAELKQAKVQISKMEISNASLKTDIASLREQLRNTRNNDKGESDGALDARQIQDDNTRLKKDITALEELVSNQTALMNQKETQMDLKVKSFESRIQTLKEEVAELEVNSKDDMAAFLKKQESDVAIIDGLRKKNEELLALSKQKGPKAQDQSEELQIVYEELAALEANFNKQFSELQALQELLKKKEAAIEDLSDASHGSGKSALSEENSRLKSELASLQQLLKDIQNEDELKKQASARYGHLENELRLLKEEKENIAKSNTKLREENEELATSANDLLEEIEVAEKNQQKSSLKIKELEDEIAEAKRKYEEGESLHDKRHKEAQKELDELKDARRQDEKARLKLEKTNESLEKDIDTLLTEIKDLQGLLHDRSSDLSESHKQLTSQIQLLESAKTTLSESNRKLEAQTVDMKVQIEQLQNQHQQRIDELSKLQNQQPKDSMEKLKLQRLVSSSETKIEELQKKFNELEDSLQEKNNLLRKEQTEGRKLDKLLQEAKEENEALKSSKEELAKQLTLVNEEVEKLSLSLRQQTRSVNTLEGVEKSLREQIESLTAELRTKSNTRLRPSLSDIHIKLEAAQLELTTKTEKLGETEQLLKDEKEAKEKLYNLLLEKDSQITQLNRAKEQDNRKLRSTEVEIQSLRADIESLTMQSKMQVEKLEKVKADLANEEKRAKEAEINAKQMAHQLKTKVTEFKKLNRQSATSNQKMKRMSSRYNDDILMLKNQIKNLKIGFKTQIKRERDLESKLATSQDENRQLKEQIRQSEDPLYHLMLKTVDTLLGDQKREAQDGSITKLTPLIKKYEGRIFFTSLLEKHVSASVTEKEIKTQNFMMLLFMINLCLTQLSLDNPGDYISAKIILMVSSKIYRSETLKGGQVKREDIMPFVKDHPVWENLSFWEEYFFDSLATVFREKFGERSRGFKKAHKEFVESFLEKFISNMVGWGRLTEEERQKFVKSIRSSIDLDVEKSWDDEAEESSESSESSSASGVSSDTDFAIADDDASSVDWTDSDDEDFLGEDSSDSDWSDDEDEATTTTSTSTAK